MQISQSSERDCPDARYHVNVGKLLANVKTVLKWADGAKVKIELDGQILQLLGPKTEQDLVKPTKKTKKVREFSFHTFPSGGCSPCRGSLEVLLHRLM